MFDLMKKKLNRKGFTLIELIVVIAILGILIAIAVPRLGAFQAAAADRANESNAKLATNVAQIIFADIGRFPTAVEWPFTDNKLTTTQATIPAADGKQYIAQDIVLRTGGKYTGFSYDAANGLVTLTP